MKPNWTLRLDRPVTVDGHELRTLGDIGRYAAALPAAMAKLPEWQFAAGVIERAAHREEPVLHALVAFCEALKLPPPPPRKKSAKKYRVIG